MVAAELVTCDAAGMLLLHECRGGRGRGGDGVRRSDGGEVPTVLVAVTVNVYVVPSVSPLISASGGLPDMVVGA